MAVLVYKDLSYKINGALFEVYNFLGYGHREVIYQKSLAEEFKRRNIPFEREKRLDVYFKETKVGLYIPDFVIDKKIIIETKSLEYLPLKLSTQLTNYLKATNFHLGILVNFGNTKIEIIRRIWGDNGISEN